MNDRTTFAGTSYATPDRRDRAYVETYLLADGRNNRAMIREILAERTDAELAEDMLDDWPDEHIDLAAATELIADFRARVAAGEYDD
jgi:hypothetical protein